MTTRTNALGQVIGTELPGWTPPPVPPRTILAGRTCRVEPFDLARHADDLRAACAQDASGGMWTYLPYGPFATDAQFNQWLASHAATPDPMAHAIVESASKRTVGTASFMRITPTSGSIELGHVIFSPALQRSIVATEAMFLMMRRAFELGYRRYEWKCDALNAPSRRAAQRLGFSFEGIFRQATVYKSRTRDTAWYSVIDSEWPALEACFVQWLAPTNFDVEGRQRVRLSELTRPLLHSLG